jgi:Tfp pilus assembly protein PilN
MSRTSTDTVESLTTGHTLPRVNLLPPEVHEARKLRRLQLGLGAGVAAIVVVLGGVYVMEAQSAHQASDELASAQSQTTVLNAQKAQFADVPRTLSAIQSAEDARQTAMTDDVSWYRYLNDLSYITPANTWLTTLTISVGSAPGTTTATTGAASAPTGLTSAGVATVAFQGTAKNHNDVAAWLDALAKEKGWTNVYFTNSSSGMIGTTPVVNFTSSLNVSAAALSHRYDRKDS